MARMVDLIREGAAPASMMRRAAQGGLSLPADEAIEILVVLAGRQEFMAEAERTLENWNEQALINVASNADASPEVLSYLLKLHANRPTVVGALSENPALPLEELEPTASHGSTEVLRAMMQSARVRESVRLLELISTNPEAEAVVPLRVPWVPTTQEGADEEVAASFLAQHSSEIAREDGQPFELVAGTEDEDDQLDRLLTQVKHGVTSVAPEEREKISLLQNLARMRVGERIKLAVRGNREERMILIRDRSKLVSLAVLESPKITDTEMEGFAAMKNVQDTVLRTISTKRRYMKLYGVVRALVNNPKTPLDVALPLVAHLLVKEQRALSLNKNVNETVRKMAIKLYRLKMERKKDD
jgi:hypothetical protein